MNPCEYKDISAEETEAQGEGRKLPMARQRGKRDSTGDERLGLCGHFHCSCLDLGPVYAPLMSAEGAVLRGGCPIIRQRTPSTKGHPNCFCPAWLCCVHGSALGGERAHSEGSMPAGQAFGVSPGGSSAVRLTPTCRCPVLRKAQDSLALQSGRRTAKFKRVCSSMLGFPHSPFYCFNCRAGL